MRRILLIILLFLPLSGRADLASVGYVEDRTAHQVQTTGDQEISGIKTFAASPIVPTPPLPQPESTEE